MASIEEDEDLIALRSAVLASMKAKPKETDIIEEDAELLALRQAALQSKRQQHIAGQNIPNHTEQLAIGKVQRLAVPFSPASPKQFHNASQSQGWKNLIVIPLQEEQAPPKQPRPPQPSSHKSTLLLPQDKWTGGGASGGGGDANDASPIKETKASSKFSRFESHDSDSEDEDEEEEESDKSEEVDLLEKQIEQFLHSPNDQGDSCNESDQGPAVRADSDHSGGKRPVVNSQTDHVVDEIPCARPNSDGQHAVIEPEAEQNKGNVDDLKCCDNNNVEDTMIETTETNKDVRSRSSSRARSSSTSSSGSSSSSHSSGSSSSWSSSLSSGSRPLSVSPDCHKSAITASRQNENCGAKTVVRSTARRPPVPSGERRMHKSNWEHDADSRSILLKVGGGRLSLYSDEHTRGRHHDMTQTTRTEPPREVSTRKHPRDRLGHRAAPTLDAHKDVREKLEGRKRKFASCKTIQPNKHGSTIVLKSAAPSGNVTTDKENRQSNIKLRLGVDKYRPHSRKDDRTHTDYTCPGNEHAKTKPHLTKVKERLDSFKSDELSDSSDLFSFSDTDSDDASSAPWRQKNTIERDKNQINQERCIRRRNDRCVDGLVVTPPRGGARGQNLHHRGRRLRQAPPQARRFKPRDDRVWTTHHEASGSEDEVHRRGNRRSLRSVMSVVKKNADSANSHGSRSRSSSRNREHKRHKRKDDLVVVDVQLDEPSKSFVVRGEGSLQTKGKGKASREEDARSIIQRLKRKGPSDVEVELAVNEVKKAKKLSSVKARVSPTINITFKKDEELPKSDARMSVHERLGLPRKSRHGRTVPPQLVAPPKPVSGQLESRVQVARKVVRHDEDNSSHKGTNGSRLTEGKTFTTHKHQVASLMEKDLYSKKKSLLVLKTAGRRDRREPETRPHVKAEHDSQDDSDDKKTTGSVGHHYESELDAKIRKIKEKNDQIMRRKQQIEEDKKKYG